MGMSHPPQCQERLLNTTILLTHWLDGIDPRVFYLRCSQTVFFTREQSWGASVAPDSFDLFDFSWHGKMGACFEAVGHNVLTQANGCDSHGGHPKNILPWWADGNQRKSISNDRLLLSTQLIQLVIALDLIEWLHTVLTLRQVYVRAHTHTHLWVHLTP